VTSRAIRTRLAPGLIIALALSAGCGSTVSGGSQASSGAGNSAQLSTGGQQGNQGGNGGLTAPAGTGSSAFGAAGPSGTTAGGQSAQGGSLPSGGGGTTSTGGSRLIPANAPGITASTITIALGYSSDSGSADAGLGAAGAAASYDPRNVTDSVFAYANAHGGFAGRKLKAIYYNYSVAQDRTAQDQSACAHYTQDNKVFAIYTDTDELRACAEHAHVLAIATGAAETSQTFKKYPHYLDVSGLRLDRLGQVTVEGLVPQHYFTGKLGLLTWDDPDYRRTMADGYLPALSKHGIKPATDPVYVTVPQAAGALGDTTAAISNAVTKFKALGIDHVIIQDGAAGVFKGDGLTFEFMQQAKSQGYYPRYGGNADNDVGGTTNPTDEEDHMLVVSDSDLDSRADVGWHLNAQREKCYQIEAAAGYPVKQSNGNDEAQAAVSCELAWFLQRVLNNMSFITVDNFLQAVTGLGTSYQSTLVYGTYLAPGRRDGSDDVRVLEYLVSCSCTQYKGPPYRVG
jgi:hypothetical protein